MFQIPCHHSTLLGTIPHFFRHFCVLIGQPVSPQWGAGGEVIWTKSKSETIPSRHEISISELHFESPFLCPPFPSPCTKHLAPGTSPSGVCLKRTFKMQFRKAFFRSLVHPSRKLWPKPNSGNSVPCILPCQIGGLQNLMKERYLSKTPFLTLVYLSNVTQNCPAFLEIPKKCFYESVQCSSYY